MNREKTIEVCRKLFAIASEGNGNPFEKATADGHLKRIMGQNNLTITDIHPEAVEWVRFRYSVAWEKDIYHGIYSKLCRRRAFKCDTKNRYLWLKCTAGQEIEVTRLFFIYKRAFAKEIKKLSRAFIIQNQIWNPSDVYEDEDELKDAQPSKSSHDAMNVEDLLKMAAGINEVSINKEIETMVKNP